MSRGTEWIPMDKYLAQEFKSIKREFSMIEAMFALTLDIDNGRRGSIAGYAQQWKWSRNKVRRFIENVMNEKGHIKDSKRTVKGHPIHFIDKGLWSKKDTNGTLKGHKEDTTTNPIILESNNTPPNPPKGGGAPKRKNLKKEFKDYLIEKISGTSFEQYQEKLVEFVDYRMSLPAGSRYKTTKGIDGLLTSVGDLLRANLEPVACLDKTMEEEWLKPKVDYFNKGGKNGKKPVNGTGINYTGHDNRPPVIPTRTPTYE